MNWKLLNNIIKDGNTFLLSTHVNPDGDGLGSGDVDVQCLESILEGWVENDSDFEPECPTNDIDTCGICGGNNS